LSLDARRFANLWFGGKGLGYKEGADYQKQRYEVSRSIHMVSPYLFPGKFNRHQGDKAIVPLVTADQKTEVA
jgi:hypothetical protein